MFLITGPSGAGKSTVARRLAARFVRGVHVESDFFRRSIVSGRHEMTPQLSPDAVSQLRLRYRLAATVANAYFEAGFTVAMEDVIAGPLLAECAELLQGRPLHIVVLMPSIEAVERRDRSRAGSGYDHWSPDQLYEGFLEHTPRIGTWLDTSNETPDETVDRILASTQD